MATILEMIGSELKTHNLTLFPGEIGKNDFIIEDQYISKLPVYIISPSEYYPKFRKSPYGIEMACLYQIPSPDVTIKPNFLIFFFFNEVSEKTEYVIMETDNFPVIINNERRALTRDGGFEMKIYALEGNLIYDVTGIGAEGTWYFVGGRMGDTIGMDITVYLNRWDKISDFFKPKND